MSDGTVKVYVRKGEDERERTLAFRIPEGMDPLVLLERGAAIDGNQAILTVLWEPRSAHGDGAFTCPDLNDGTEISGQSMTRVLGESQRALVRFLRECGYGVQFA